MNIFIIQTIIMIILVAIIFYLIMYNKSLKLERRISKYSIESIKDDSISFFDLISSSYKELLNKTSNLLVKSVFLKKYSFKYNKYITYENDKDTTAMDFVSNKLYIMLALFLIVLFARIIEGRLMSLLDILISLLLGFFLLDIYLKFYDYVKKKKIEQDLLNAIIIMNNAFRSGMSTMQAIEIVSKELKGPIAQEFKKMHLEISYGLSLDVVFDRFSKRVESEEVSYITSSLSILNKTGGNIIKVFSSIEKMLFSKRKLRSEMKSLTSSSRMISKILLIMPFIFVVIISILNPSYFAPLITTSIGRLILFMIILVYSLYAFIVNRIMKVRFN
ncbi:MAG: type II secretion system F family protein [Bacilli bacterium]|nr:type II secretion system F family protein [Bacilli bacterium]